MLLVYRNKVVSAEKRIAWLRLAVVLINCYVFLFLLPQDLITPGIAYPILILSLIYSIGIIAIRPFLNFKTLLPSYTTALIDAGFITAWVYATGNYHSPFFMLWMISIIGVAYRYMMLETIIIACIYLLSYSMILMVEPGNISPAVLVLRFSYILFTAITAALMSKENVNSLQDKVRLENSEKDLVLAHGNLKKLVDERTSELKLMNQKLQEEINTRKKYEKSRDELLANLESTNKELESFAYIVSHDLKAPLRGIATLTEWIVSDLGDDIDDEVQEKIAMLRQRVEKMKSLIDAILRLSRSGRKEENKVLLDPKDILSEITELLQPEKKVKIVLREPMHKVWFDRTSLFQIFENLISNAQKYGPETDCTVIISSTKKDGHIHFSVQDNGPGIPETMHDKVFAIFQTGPKPTKDSTGVGLAIVKRILEKAGGKVWIDKELKTGCNFILQIPENLTYNPDLDAEAQKDSQVGN